MRTLTMWSEPRDDTAAMLVMANLLTSGKSMQDCVALAATKWGWEPERTTELVRAAVRQSSAANLDRVELIAMLMMRADQLQATAIKSGDTATAIRAGAECRALLETPSRLS